MQNIRLQVSLAQAQVAARQGDWSPWLQWLQQALRSETLHLSSVQGLQEQELQEQDGHEPEMLVRSMLDFALDILQQGDFQERWDVAKVIPQFGDRAIAPLLALLRNDAIDPDVRWFAARIVGEFHQPDVLVALVDVLQPSNPDELHNAAITALAEFGLKAIAPLSALLKAPETRLLAIRTLAQMRHAATVPLLLQSVHDQQPLVRETVIEALSSVDDLCIPSVLIAALGDPSSAVRQAAVTGLGLRAELFNESSHDVDLVALIKPLLSDLILEVCQQAAIALSRLGTDAAASALFEVLQAPHAPPPLKIDMVRSLGWMETSVALTYLQQFLQHDTTSPERVPVVQEIITVLGRVETPLMQEHATYLLLEWLQMAHVALHQPAIRQALALSLGQLGNPIALEPLIQLLADADWGVKLHAVAALKQLDAAAARLRLEALASDDNLSLELKQGVAIALQEW